MGNIADAISPIYRGIQDDIDTRLTTFEIQTIDYRCELQARARAETVQNLPEYVSRQYGRRQVVIYTMDFQTVFRCALCRRTYQSWEQWVVADHTLCNKKMDEVHSAIFCLWAFRAHVWLCGTSIIPREVFGEILSLLQRAVCSSDV